MPAPSSAKPYVWGGDGDPGLDCSGLTNAVYAAAAIVCPAPSREQFVVRPLVDGKPITSGSTSAAAP
ncbi:NlpC/P60 family protein [Amycolatopsis sp. NPDC051106]|uniref:NlpC/P60 family protein n=1 Tax=unclassified Amycolatopsis TaxID=2618356 RepID=UPI00342891C0